MGEAVPAGDYAFGGLCQNTAISLSSHVDVLIALGTVPNMEIKQVFWSLFEYLTDQGMRPRTRNVSIQLQSRGLYLDLIPAYRDRATSGNILFNKRTGVEVHTDVAQHIHLVANSGRQQEMAVRVALGAKRAHLQ